MKQYPDSDHLKNAYARFAWEAKNPPRLRKALAAIKGPPDMNIWVSLENFHMAEREAHTASL